MYLEFVLIRYGKKGRCRNDCHEERKLLYSQVPRNNGHGTQGHTGKPVRRQNGQNGQRAKRGPKPLVVVFMGRNGHPSVGSCVHFVLGSENNFGRCWALRVVPSCLVLDPGIILGREIVSWIAEA